MIKLIAADLDGTLLAPGGFEMPEGNRTAIAKAVSRGLRFVVCTGRLFAGARKYALEIEGDQPVICVNGAVVRMSRSLQWLRRVSMDPVLAGEALEVMREAGVRPWFYEGDVCRAEEITPALENMKARTGAQVILTRCLEDCLSGRPEKIIAVMEPLRAKALQRRLEERLGGRLYVTRSGQRQVEVLSPEGTKGKALEAVARRWGIARDEIAAFGDNLNDIELFKAAGLRVAMDNGDEDLKARADVIAPPNGEAGVGQVIERLLAGTL
ncbi:MAG: Cof-type HAD-IIB family hydrolase [Pyramidobacter sp.]|jgi:Cof subfamily protein (haloacid dehalogenase superfamily)